jgi:hypothetical protein
VRKTLLFLLAAILLIPAIQASATTYTYVGSYTVDSGPIWGSNPLAYSGVSAAALLFGGSSSDYVISTVDDNAADINFMANYDVIGGSSEVFADDYFRGTEGTTHYQDAFGSDTDTNTVSAYVSDHGNDNVNYVFRANVASPVPEPGSLALLSTGLVAVGATLRRRIFNR